MARILIVEDEANYRDYLSRALVRGYHEVATATNGTQALKIGTSFRPDILVADWMLKNHVHGLQVSQALRHVVNNLKTILITGFPSLDLRAEAEESGIGTFLPKPFGLEDFRKSVEAAAAPSPASAFETNIGIVEIDSAEAIVFANARAEAMFALTKAGPRPKNLSDLDFGFVSFDAEDRSQWYEALPSGIEGGNWHLRKLKLADKNGYIVIMLEDTHRALRNSAVVKLLIRAHGGNSASAEWPFEGRILIIDDEPVLRRSIALQFESAGAVCHSCGSYSSAIYTLERDPGITHVLLDYGMPCRTTYDGGINQFLSNLRERQPGMKIIGTSGDARAEEFEALGITTYLQKPWQPQDLIKLLTITH